MRQAAARTFTSSRPLFALAAAVAAALSLAPSTASAERIYRYVDRDGIMVITNIGRGSSRRSASSRSEVRASGARDVVKSRAVDFDPYLDEACTLYKIPVALARAVVAAESNYNPMAVSQKGAMGLMQLMPQTAAEMFVSDAFDPKQNIHGGVRYLRVLANMFNGDMIRIVAAYNAGPDAVRKAGGIPNISETQDYVRKVLRYYYAFKDPVDS